MTRVMKYTIPLAVILVLLTSSTFSITVPAAKSISQPPVKTTGTIFSSTFGASTLKRAGLSPPEVMGSISLGFDGLSAITMDTANGYLYGLDSGSQTVKVIDPMNQSVISNITLGQQASSIAYDSLNGKIYVGEQVGIAVINCTRNAVSDYLTLNSSVLSIVFDGVSGLLYASFPQSASGAGYVLAINGTTDSVEYKITGFISPDGLAVNTSSGDVYVADQLLQGIETVNATSNTIVNSTPLGKDALIPAYDSSNGDVFLSIGDNVLLVNTQNGKVIWNTSVGTGALCLAYDNATGNLYAGAFSNGYLYVINATTGVTLKTIQFRDGVYGVYYDGISGKVFATSVYKLVEFDQRTNQANWTMEPGTYPQYLNYDASTKSIIVVDSRNNRLQAVDSNHGFHAQNIVFNESLTQVLSDQVTGKIFVTAYNSNQLYVLSDSSYAILNILNTGTNPWGMALDRSTQMLYVMNTNSENITVVNATTGEIAGKIYVGYYPNQASAPYQATWDSINHNVYFTNILQTDILELNTSNDRISTVTSVQSPPSGIAFDSWNGDLYVSSWSNNRVTVINATNHSVIGYIQVGLDPNSILFDPYSGYVYTANMGSNNLSVIDGTSKVVPGGIPVGDGPYSMAYGNSGGDVYVANSYSDNISIVGWKSYRVTFNETGLSSGSWFINITGAERFQSGPINSTSFEFNLPDGSYDYVVNGAGNSVATPASGTFTIYHTGYSNSIVFRNLVGPGILTSPLLILTYLVIMSLAAIVYNIRRKKR